MKRDDSDDDGLGGETGDAAPKKRTSGRQALPKNLLRERIVHDLAEEEKHCASCQKDLRSIGEETSERYEYVQSPEGRAVRYTLKNWTALNRYCEDGDLEIDNNHTERSIRGVAVGRNNWIFFGSDQGGHTAAVLRSFVSSCQRVGVDPYAWFKDVLSRIAAYPITRVAELLPHNWKLAQA